MHITWVESDKPFTLLGHGVEFFHDDLSSDDVVAFIDGFNGWYHPGDHATVRILTTCPNPAIGSDQWAEITLRTREAVLAVLADKSQLKTYLRNTSEQAVKAGPIHINVNA